MLASYVPKVVVRRLCSTINTNAIKPSEMETFPACVVFADISGFTPLTEKLASLGLQGIEKLTTVLNNYFDKLIKTIHEHGGDIVKVSKNQVLLLTDFPSLLVMQYWLCGQLPRERVYLE